MARHKNVNWNLIEGTPQPGGNTTHTWESIHSALLMDIRDELKELNSLLRCPGFLSIPARLDAIGRNTAWSRKKRTKK